MSENIFNVGDRVAVFGPHSTGTTPSRIGVIAKMHKNGNVVLDNDPGTQYRQTGTEAGSDKSWRKGQIAPLTDDLARRHRDGVARARSARMLDEARAALAGKTAEELAPLMDTLRAFIGAPSQSREG